MTGDGIHTVRFAGSDGSDGGTIVRIDTTPPKVTGTSDAVPSDEGFTAGPVTVNWACTDATSGVESCPDPTTLSTEGLGVTANSGDAADNAGQTAKARSVR